MPPPKKRSLADEIADLINPAPAKGAARGAALVHFTSSRRRCLPPACLPPPPTAAAAPEELCDAVVPARLVSQSLTPMPTSLALAQP